jgi:hypothetical protein
MISITSLLNEAYSEKSGFDPVGKLIPGGEFNTPAGGQIPEGSYATKAQYGKRPPKGSDHTSTMGMFKTKIGQTGSDNVGAIPKGVPSSHSPSA